LIVGVSVFSGTASGMRESNQFWLIRGENDSRPTACYYTVAKIALMLPCDSLHYGGIIEDYDRGGKRGDWSYCCCDTFDDCQNGICGCSRGGCFARSVLSSAPDHSRYQECHHGKDYKKVTIFFDYLTHVFLPKYLNMLNKQQNIKKYGLNGKNKRRRVEQRRLYIAFSSSLLSNGRYRRFHLCPRDYFLSPSAAEPYPKT
jgi:hypothetical protein